MPKKMHAKRVFIKKVSCLLLEALSCEATAMGDIVWTMMAPYAESRRRMNWLASGRGREEYRTQRGAFPALDHLVNRYREHKKYHALLTLLEKDGLVASTGSGKMRTWKLTLMGKEMLSKEERRWRVEDYVRDGGVTIVSYDIPEKIKKERAQLREILRLSGFEPIQQSVWFAKKQVTQMFLGYLKERELIPYVQIFEVAKTGTLRLIKTTRPSS